MNKHSQSQRLQKQSGEAFYDCPKCKDTGVVVIAQGEDIKGNVKYPNGIWRYDALYGECECVKRERLEKRFKNSMIPKEFNDAQFKNFRRDEPFQKSMYDAMTGYLKDFDSIRNTEHNSFGFIAAFGETNIRNLQSMADKAKAKREHNNFGIGKTHLQVAAAKWLMKNGYSTLVVSDAVFMDELVRAKMLNDQGERLHELLHSAETVDVLIWDDMGKAKTSETKENLYYQIVNARSRQHRPIIYSSNEDKGTLADKIGYATASRLNGMADGHLYEVEGQDQRTKKVIRQHG